MFQRKFYQKQNSNKELACPIGDGFIYTTPDNIKEQADFKTTRKFVQSELPEYWWPQVAFYAWWNGVTKWKVDIVYIGSSYPKKKDIPAWAPTEDDDCRAPNLICYTVQFEDEEIEEYVNFVLDRAEELQQYLSEWGRFVDGYGKVCVPPMEQSFKCGECSYAFQCNLGE